MTFQVEFRCLDFEEKNSKYNPNNDKNNRENNVNEGRVCENNNNGDRRRISS
jgi:hypothetical protein